MHTRKDNAPENVFFYNGYRLNVNPTQYWF